MDAQTELEIHHACLKLVTRYCHVIDHGEGSKVADLFTEDGVWDSRENTMTGKQGILEEFTAREDNKGRMSRHVCNNFLLDIESPTRATGCVYFTLYRVDGDPARKWSELNGPDVVGEYRDTFVKTDEGWRIERRDVSANFLKVPAQ